MDDMIEFVNIVLLIVQILVFLHALSRLSKKIVDFGAIFVVMYSLWYVPIIYDLLLGGHVFESVYQNLLKVYAHFFVYDAALLTQLNLATTLIMVAFEVGYSTQCDKKPIQFTYQTSSSFREDRFLIAQGILFAIWLLLEVRGFFMSGASLKAFFLATKKDMYGSEIVRILVLKLPILMLGNALYYNATKNKKSYGIAYLVMIFVSSFQTNQRREMIANFLFVLILYICYFATLRKQKGLDAIIINKKIRRIVIVSFVAVLCMVPLFWYLRVFSNQYAKGLTNVTFSRSFMELLLSGSGVTGFPTLIIYRQFGEEMGVSFYLRELFFTLESFIPRSLFPEKMTALNIFIRDSLGVSNNLSMFYINELFYTYGIFAFPVSFLVGHYLSKFYRRFIVGTTFADKFYMAFFLSSIIKLFKNGLSSFVISVVFFSILIFLDFSYLGIAEQIKISKRKLVLRKGNRIGNE